MEQTAGHAGMPGAYPYSTISGGGQRLAPGRPRTGAPAGPAMPPLAAGPGFDDDGEDD